MKLAIIGVGPRGVSALEQLLEQLSDTQLSVLPHITLFESTDMIGYGHVYNIDQPDTNWINITERALKELPARGAITIHDTFIPSFPSYMDSEFSVTPKDVDSQYPDIFPLRSNIGYYLKYRFDSLIEALQSLSMITIIKATVVNVEHVNDTILLTTAKGEQYTFDETLLTIGHQPTEIGDQIQKWTDHVNQHSQLVNITDAYPIRNIKEKIKTSHHHKIALRGFGLAAIDVIRALASHYGGTFQMDNNNMDALSFTPGEEQISIYPFSLDGLPSVPKPYSPAEDQKYTPNDHQLNALRVKIQKGIQNNESNHLFFVSAMTAIIKEMYLSFYSGNEHISNEAEIENVILHWIMNGTSEDKYMTAEELSTLDMIQLHISMSKGIKAPNLDYYAGQVWRHCQPLIYQLISHSPLEDLVVSEIIAIDERIKRYSYGPPVSSMEQIVLLEQAGVIDLKHIENPEIEITNRGWTLKSDATETTVSAMINTVIDSPELRQVTSPIITNLLRNDKIQAVHRRLGLDIQANGKINVPDQKNTVPIYVLGRLVKGSVIGVDAILECFGERSLHWAKSCAQRILDHPSNH